MSTSDTGAHGVAQIVSHNAEPARIAPATWYLIGSLYTTQSLALMFFVVAFVAILRAQGASLDQIGMVYALGMVWPFKFLWAPLVDAFGSKRCGHYRSWLLGMQGAMVVVLGVMSQYDPVRDFTTIYMLCLGIALLSATQDVAADGLVCRLLPATARGLANGLQIAGNLLGTLLGAGVVLMAYRDLGWSGSMWLLAVVTAVTWVQLWAFREPAWPLAGAPSVAAKLRRFWSFWRAPGRGYWLAVLTLYPIGSGLVYGLITPTLVDAGWALDRIGLVLNVAGSLAGALSAVAAGGLIRNIGRRRAMIGAAALQIVGIGAIWLIVLGQHGVLTATTAVVIYYLCYNPAAVVLALLMMDEASAASPATDYALQVSVNQFFAFGMIAASAWIAQSAGYAATMWMATAAGLAALALSHGYRATAKSGGRA